MARIILVNPPYPIEELPSPPMGLLYLATYMISKGHEVIIEDNVVNPHSPERARRIIEEYRPDIVGSTAVTMNVKKALSIIDDYKKINSDIVTVMGGPHVTFDAENILKDYPSVDFIVRGEGEVTFDKFASYLDGRGDIQTVLGLSYKKGDIVIHNEPRPFIEDINIIPVPDRSLIEQSKYRALGFPINMVTSRGCPHQCIFCIGRKMVGKKVRYFDVQRVVDEFEMLASLGFAQVNIVDDLFTSNKARCVEICDEIVKRGIKQQWTAFARVDTINEEVMHALRRANCRELCFGVESGDQGILDTAKKKITRDMIKNAARLSKETGVRSLASYILGLPGETAQTMRETWTFAEEMGVPYGFHILSPFPGSEVWDEHEKYGIKILTKDWDRYDANQPVCELPTVSTREIEDIYTQFYGRCRNNFIRDLEAYEAGEQLSEEAESQVRGFFNFMFVHGLITGELISEYQKNNKRNGKDIVDDFGHFLSEKGVSTQDRAVSLLNDLMQKGCLAVHKVDGIDTIHWT